MNRLDLPQGTLDLMILTILNRETLCGYVLSQRLAGLSHESFQVNPGSLVPALYKLEQDGDLQGEWRLTENNQNTKFYSITATGRKQLDRQSQWWTKSRLPLAAF